MYKTNIHNKNKLIVASIAIVVAFTLFASPIVAVDDAFATKKKNGNVARGIMLLISPLVEIEWCGARNGRVDSTRRGSTVPATSRTARPPARRRARAAAGSPGRGGPASSDRRPGRAGQQQVVCASGRDDRRADRRGVAADVPQVGLLGLAVVGVRAAAEQPRDIAQRARAVHGDAGGEPRGRLVIGGDDESVEADARRGLRDRDRPADYAQLTRELQVAPEAPVRAAGPRGPGRWRRGSRRRSAGCSRRRCAGCAPARRSRQHGRAASHSRSCRSRQSPARVSHARRDRRGRRS